jgi:hypothetical protein
LTLQLSEFAIAYLYFYAWSFKTDIRDWLKVTSLAVLSFSTLALLLEVGAEIIGSDWLVAAIETLVPHGIFRWLFLTLFVLAVIFLVWHHFHEARKPGYEYVFVKRLCTFLEGVEGAEGVTGAPSLHQSLEIFHGVLKRAGMAHISVHMPAGELLAIPPDGVFPSVSDSGFFVTLEPGVGVAGMVYEDCQPRYVPRVFLPFRVGTWSWVPNIWFPHAVRFRFRQSPQAGWGVELGDEEVDFFGVQKPDSGGRPLFNSFLSVPIKSARSANCIGVLNLDFNRIDPLDKADIAMAAVMGLLLGWDLGTTRPTGEGLNNA